MVDHDPKIKDDLDEYIAMKTGGKPDPKPKSKEGEKKPSHKSEPNPFVEKYKDNPYVKEGRENWYKGLHEDFPLGGGKVKDVVYNVARQSKVNPALLYTSAMEEGMSGSLWAPDNVGTAYGAWAKKNMDKGEQFPVDGFYNYGLDRFSDYYPQLKKKGYLPEGFDKKFTKYQATNEKNEKVNTAAFASDADALTAKAAMMRQSQDEISDYAKQKGIKLTDKQKDFFTLATYNGGEGLGKKMLESYKDKGYLKDEKFLDPKFKPASYEGVYKNVQHRIQNANALTNENYFSDFTTEPPAPNPPPKKEDKK